jgi:hypothetical protein
MSHMCFYNQPYLIKPAKFDLRLQRSAVTVIFYKHEQALNCEMSGSHGDEYEDGCLLGCCAL